VKSIFLLLSLFITSISHSQKVPNSVLNDSSYKIVIAGPQYNTDPTHQKRWGTHYRKEWATPVKVKVVKLDTLAGGLTPYEKGGGRQSKTLRLRDKEGREYVLRSIDKSFGKALPEFTRALSLRLLLMTRFPLHILIQQLLLRPWQKRLKFIIHGLKLFSYRNNLH
jgi:hypothetical protein